MNVLRFLRILPISIITYDGLMCQTQTKFSRVNIKNRVSYSRWAHRKHSKVILPEKENEDTIEDKNVEKAVKNTKEYRSDIESFSKPAKKIYRHTNLDNEEEYSSDDEDLVVTNNDNLQIQGTEYTKLLNTDPTLSQLMLKVKSRRTREKSGLMMLEGKRLNQDAILAGFVPQKMFFTRPKDVESLSMPSGVVQLFKVTYKTMKLWSSVQTAPGVIGFYKIPEAGAVKEDPNSLPLTVICDNIRDPGNVGSILRVSAGVGCSKVVFVKGCADVWDSKVLRAASGGHFRVPLEQDIPWDDVNHYLDVNTSVLLADNKEKVKDDDLMSSFLPLVPYHSVNFSAFSSVAVVIGGESEGLSKEAVLLSRYRNGVRLHIPLANDVESLNTGAALSVILFEIRRQLTRHQDEEVHIKQ